MQAKYNANLTSYFKKNTNPKSLPLKIEDMFYSGFFPLSYSEILVKMYQQGSVFVFQWCC